MIRSNIILDVFTWKYISKRGIYHNKKTFKLNLKVHHDEQKEEEF